MQYFKPAGPSTFAGDAMPFTHNGVFHLIYLLDHGHHQDLGGLGGHQWAHATTTDLVHWEHHPLAIAITEPWEGSICTGSVFVYDSTYYAFYATRMRDWTQHVGLATSTDGIHFEKQAPNPLASPSGRYDPEHFRDPFVFQDPATGTFHMLVTSILAEPELAGHDGCLAHLTSTDLRTWEEAEPFLITGYRGAPECADLFIWNDWTYLIFSHDLVAHYRMARTSLGPWLRPSMDTFDGPLAAVMKTAPLGDRRIGVAWIGTREGDTDTGTRQWGGNLFLRELIQHADGTLGTRFVPEAIPIHGQPLDLPVSATTAHVAGSASAIGVGSSQGMTVAAVTGIPRTCRITMRIDPRGSGPRTASEFGMRLRTAGQLAEGYDLRFRPHDATVTLQGAGLTQVHEIKHPFNLDIVAYGDIIDVCIAGQRCLINRLPEQRGDHLVLYSRDSPVSFENIEVVPQL
ncbi:MAG: hypothetical protein J7M39_13085 [Anaerolineae bacterium]|nr:hypothetical protein [Anaerolineae bacterium]